MYSQYSQDVSASANYRERQTLINLFRSLGSRNRFVARLISCDPSLQSSNQAQAQAHPLLPDGFGCVHRGMQSG